MVHKAKAIRRGGPRLFFQASGSFDTFVHEADHIQSDETLSCVHRKQGTAGLNVA